MWLHTKNDKDLLRTLFEGKGYTSRKAWEVFLERYSNLFLKIIWQFENDHDQAMEKYVYVCSKLANNEYSLLRKYTPEKFDNPPALSTYLTVVVRNLCVEQFRRTRKEREIERKTISFDDAATTFSETGRSESGVISKLDEKLLLKKLTEEEKQLFRLRYTENQTAKEIAEAMNLSSRRVYYELDKLAETIIRKLNL